MVRRVMALLALGSAPGLGLAQDSAVYYGPAPQCVELDGFRGIQAVVPVAGFAVFPPPDGVHGFSELPFARQTHVVHGGFGNDGLRFNLGNDHAIEQFRSLDLQQPLAPAMKDLGAKWWPDRLRHDD